MGRSLPIQTDFSSGKLGEDIEQRYELPEVKAGLKRCDNFIPISKGILKRRKGRVPFYTLPLVRKGKLIPYYINYKSTYVLAITDDGFLRFIGEDGMYQNPTSPPEEIMPDTDLTSGSPETRSQFTGESGTRIDDYTFGPGETPFMDSKLPITREFQDWMAIKVNIPVGTEAENHVYSIATSVVENLGEDDIKVYKISIVTDPDTNANQQAVRYQSIGLPVVDEPFNPGGASIVWVKLEFIRSEPTTQELMMETPTLSVVNQDNPGNVFEEAHDFAGIDFSEIQYAVSPDGRYIYITHRDVEPYRIEYDKDAKTFLFKKLITDTIISPVPPEWVAGDYPGSCAFFGNRIYFGGNKTYNSMVWASAVGDYDDFDFTGGGTIVLSTAMTFSLDSYGDIQWMSVARSSFVFGTDVGHFVLKSANNQSEFGLALGPGNIAAKQETAYGTKRVQPVVVGDRIIYATGDGLKLRDFSYLDNEKSYVSKDLSFNSSDIITNPIKELTYLLDPNSLIKCRLSNDKTVVCSYQKHLDIIGWYNEPTQSVTRAISHMKTYGTFRTVSLIVDIGGESTLQIEEVGDNYLDSMTSITHEPPSTGISALNLKGRSVSVLADGMLYTDVQIDAFGVGSIDFPATFIQIGLPYSSIAETKDVNDMNQYGDGSSSTMKRYNKILTRILKSAIPIINGERNPARLYIDPMDKSIALITDDIQVVNFNYDRRANIIIEQDLPYACNILGIFGELGEEVL